MRNLIPIAAAKILAASSAGFELPRTYPSEWALMWDEGIIQAIIVCVVLEAFLGFCICRIKDG